MSLTKSIGKNTLGGGKKMNVDLKTYNRSSHDMSYIWRNTQAPGTGVPFMCEIGLPGDTWDINLQERIMTHPTVGPLFGSFKLQMDVFQCPIRLYNALLHNNTLNIGLDIKKVKLPVMDVHISSWDNPILDGKNKINTDRIDPSCLLAYLGKRGYGIVNPDMGTTQIESRFNATALIAYYDIFKNFYANKQEEDFYVISNNKVISIIEKGDDGEYHIINDEYNYPIKEGNDIALFLEDYNNNEEKTNNIYILIDYESPDSQDGYTTIAYCLDDIRTNDGEKTQITINKEQIDVIIFTTKPGAGKTNTGIGGLITETKELRSFKLEDIDKTRELLLSSGSAQVRLNENKWPEYLKTFAKKNAGQPFSYKTTIFKENIWETEARWVYQNTKTNQFGLWVKTYQSDIFNNWVNTEWIDGDNGINAITAIKIDPESNSFQLDTLNLAKKVYDMLNRIAVSGGTYQDWIETVYTNDYIQRTETPTYEGGMSAEIEFQEVISNSATTDEPLGTLAGRGTVRNAKGGNMIIKVSEPSYIIGIVSITPRVDYCQGNRFDTKLWTLDDLHKPALDAIGFQDRMLETLDTASVYYQDEMSAPKNGSLGKQPAWIDYMTNFNRTFGNFAIKDNEAFMVLNRWYESDAKNQIGDYTSYIDPQKYNYIFADTDLNAMNFWVQIGVNATARRMISAKVIPNL